MEVIKWGAITADSGAEFTEVCSCGTIYRYNRADIVKTNNVCSVTCPCCGKTKSITETPKMPRYTQDFIPYNSTYTKQCSVTDIQHLVNSSCEEVQKEEGFFYTISGDTMILAVRYDKEIYCIVARPLMEASSSDGGISW